MALPADLSQVTVTGSYVNTGTGAVGTGTVTFTSSLWVTDAAYKVRLVPATVVATLSGGAFSNVLPATNDPQTSPVFTWAISEVVNGQTNSFSAAIDYNLTTVDITALAPIAAAASTAGYLLTSSYGIVGGTAGPLDASGDVPVAQLPINTNNGIAGLGATGKLSDTLLPDSVPLRIQQAAGVYALRTTVTTSATRTVIWKGTNDPTFNAGYALASVDIWVQET